MGLPELAQALDADAKAFPDRSPERPTFVLALSFEHAQRLASERHPAEAASGFAGFVADFDLDADYARRLEVRLVGEPVQHREIWLPADRLRELNTQLRSRIRTRAAFYGPAFVGLPPLPGALEGVGAAGQLRTLGEILRYSVFEFASEIEANWKLVIENAGYWSATPPQTQGMTRQDVERTLGAIGKVWKQKLADLPLPTGTLLSR